LSRTELAQRVPAILDEIQTEIYERALKFRKDNTHAIDKWDDFVDFFTAKNDAKPEIHGGFALCHWSAGQDVLDKLKDLKVTARCIPLAGEEERGACLFSGRESKQRVLFAKSY
jgi:prolyl-tRNA synthetase